MSTALSPAAGLYRPLWGWVALATPARRHGLAPRPSRSARSIPDQYSGTARPLIIGIPAKSQPSHGRNGLRRPYAQISTRTDGPGAEAPRMKADRIGDDQSVLWHREDLGLVKAEAAHGLRGNPQRSARGLKVGAVPRGDRSLALPGQAPGGRPVRARDIDEGPLLPGDISQEKPGLH